MIIYANYGNIGNGGILLTKKETETLYDFLLEHSFVNSPFTNNAADDIFLISQLVTDYLALKGEENGDYYDYRE